MVRGARVISASMAEKRVVELGGACVPADQGLSSLGLLMQLAGNLFAAFGALLAFWSLFAMHGSGDTLWVLVLLGMSIARSLLHRSAGSQLLYGSGDGKNQRTAGIRRYIGFALMHTLLAVAMFGGKFHAPGNVVLGVGLGLAVWPVMLAIIMAMPRFRRFKDDLPLSEDKGFEGAAILMTVMGLCGLAITSGLFLVWIDSKWTTVSKGPGVFVALGIALLVGRSILHLQAGISGLRETSVDHSVELANRYANFGVISAFCAGGALLMFVMWSQFGVPGLALICVALWMLVTWPLIIRRFYGDRQFADLLAGDEAPIHRRAPDAGLTGLGWLLVAHAALSGSLLVFQLAVGDDAGGLQRLPAAVAAHSPWFSVGVLVLQAWSGFELVRMSPQSRAIANVFGVIGTAVTLYVDWPLFQALKKLDIGYNSSLVYMPVVLAMIIPIATLLLVNRKVAPTARARFKTR